MPKTETRRPAAPRGRITLTRHTIEQEHRHLDSTGDFSGLLNAIATAVKMIANQVNRGGLAAPAAAPRPRRATR